MKLSYDEQLTQSEITGNLRWVRLHNLQLPSDSSQELCLFLPSNLKAKIIDLIGPEVLVVVGRIVPVRRLRSCSLFRSPEESTSYLQTRLHAPYMRDSYRCKGLIWSHQCVETGLFSAPQLTDMYRNRRMSTRESSVGPNETELGSLLR